MGITIDLEKNHSVFIPCGCKSEVLVIEYDHTIEMADLAVYENRESYNNKMSLWQRLRYCYHILISKKPYADQILLDGRQLIELLNFLNTLNLVKK